MNTTEVIDHSRIGRKGMPRHYRAFGMVPPTKTVPIDEDGPMVEHAGLSLKEQVNAERDRRINGGFIFEGVEYQSRPEDRENIAGAATAALGAIVAGAQPGDLRWHGGAEDFAWIAADNTMHTMDAQTVYAFGQAAMAHKQAHIFAARTLKDADPIPDDFADDQWWP
ncbi:DUF4376 domain-containing protein [Nitratireductor aquibiodomus]|uniref:DUF4376 domain-containing protein n=1 Tax=Nitratireductor aquibiodomus TaxID=204799 RepID=UPI0019D36BF4|nr:DUF4376 domain-containing protein [Nitratireductor aquibiodomus]MBN7763407.1 DUF4376 domain-containing protein [Nitratireductor aquibiodomus]